VKPEPFAYHAPSTVTEALDLLAEHQWDATVLAGGQSLIPLLNLRLATPAHIVDINEISDLDDVDSSDGVVRVGALVRQREAEQSVLIRERCPLLAEAAALVGVPESRNRGTVCGSIAHGDPHGQLPTALSALEGEVVLTSRRGTRTVQPADFFRSYLSTAREPDELVTEIRAPSTDGSGWAIEEVSRAHGREPQLVATVVLTLDGNGSTRDARIALGGMDATPVRAAAAEALLRGREPTPEAIAEAAERAPEGLHPSSDLHASAAYRTHVSKALVSRALERALERAAAGSVR
jgi:CO/xanthine dehydrogenase FAD-binding subunit